MNLHGHPVSRMLTLLAVACLPCFVFSCNNAPSKDARQASAAVQSTTAAQSANSGDPEINLRCATERIRNATAPFHWSFKKVVTPGTNADWEADVTTDTIRGTLVDGSGTRTIRGSRSDATSWNTAVLILTAPLPTSTFTLVDNSSATRRAGQESVNSINAIKYTIDTSQDTTAEASLIQSVLGPKGFVKGSAWITERGCPIKFILDVEQHNQDGTVEKEHYEESMAKP